MIGSVRVSVRARRASQAASGDAAQGLAGASGVEEPHGEGQGDEGGEECEEDESSSENEGQGEAGELFDDRFGRGGEFDDGNDGADGEDQEYGDDVDGDVDAALRSLSGAHAVVAAQLVVPQAVGPGCCIELQGLIGYALTIALYVNLSRLTKQPSGARLDTFSMVRM